MTSTLIAQDLGVGPFAGTRYWPSLRAPRETFLCRGPSEKRIVSYIEPRHDRENRPHLGARQSLFGAETIGTAA